MLTILFIISSHPALMRMGYAKSAQLAVGCVSCFWCGNEIIIGGVEYWRQWSFSTTPLPLSRNMVLED
ncbi:MAG: hypothetical protein M3H12_01200, partial [Chromatiales bacterium]